MDVRKEINFCRRVSLPVLGVVENMSGYACPSCGHTERIFSPSTGGALAMCQQMEAWSEKQVYSIGATPSRFCRDFADLIGALVSVMPPTLSMRFTWDAVAHSPACSATHRTRCRSWAQCRWTAGWLRRGTRDCRSPNSIRMGRWPSASTRSSTPFCSKRTRSSARLELGCTKHPSLGTDAAMLVSSPTAECLYGQIGCIASQENSKEVTILRRRSRKSRTHEKRPSQLFSAPRGSAKMREADHFWARDVRALFPTVSGKEPTFRPGLHYPIEPYPTYPFSNIINHRPSLG